MGQARIRSWVLRAALGVLAAALLPACGDDGDDDGPGVIVFASATFPRAENSGSATITVQRAGGVVGAVSVSYCTFNGTATAGADYTAASGVLSWASGDAADKTFTVALSDDGAVEGDETVALMLLAPTGGAALGSPSGAILDITDDEAPEEGVFQFGSAIYAESEDGGGASITVVRTGGSTGTVTVPYTISDGTATAGSDYSGVSASLTFAAGVTSKSFQVAILQDIATEDDETVNLSLGAPSAGALGTQNTAVLAIADDDAPGGRFRFLGLNFGAPEGGGYASIAVIRTGNTGAAATVNYATSNGTATAGSDYTAASGTLSFAAGETVKVFTLTIADDLVDEPGGETVIMTLSTPTNGAVLGTPASATLTIADND